MPEGIVIIEWDEFTGGVVSMKYPEELDVPENFVQILQISHNFEPGIMTFKEKGVHAISVSNVELQKVIVIVLTKYEDAEDFREILGTINQAVGEIDDKSLLYNELQRLYQAAQSVFRAREAVMMKLANETAELKNYQVDLRNSLEWLLQHEDTLRKKIILTLLINGPLPLAELVGYAKLVKKATQIELKKMEKEGLLEIKDKNYILLIQYQV
jgi:hypothetical protein